MNIIDLRKNLIRSATTQRMADRRQVPYEFGSNEWLNYINKNQLDAPAFNRRQADRRAEKRKRDDRREQLTDVADIEKSYTRIFLTPAERKLIEDLYLMDLEATDSEFNTDT